jgi:DnaJ-class molecular chaperone
VALRHVIAAYSVLHDPRQRADYDAHRTERARRDQNLLAHEDPEPARRRR